MPIAPPDISSLRKAALIRRIGRRLFESLSAEAVYLFGSAARGEAGADSDLDFLVIVAHAQEPRHRLAQQGHRAVADIPAPKDIVVMTRSEWDRQQRIVNTLPYIARREGVLVAGNG